MILISVSYVEQNTKWPF